MNLLVFLLVNISILILVNSLDPDVGKDVVDLATERGYPIEEFYITTKDGYILGTFRIPYGHNESESSRDIGKPVVFLQHGLEDSAYSWVNNFRNESFAYILADHGYDVWMGNSRGNTYSKNHEYYKVDSAEFWNFSYDEMAHYDVPANIEFVLNYTNTEKLVYVGHSQGTIQMFASPHYNEELLNSKIALYIALAPIAYVHHQKSLLLDILSYMDVELLFEIFGVKQFGEGWFLDKIDPRTCELDLNLCYALFESVMGPSKNQNVTRYPVYVSQEPADTSVKNMAHWGQGVTHEKFQMYDYGSDKKNEEYYGSKYPPQYNLSKVLMPTVLFSGANDYLADPTDVETLVDNLPEGTVIDWIRMDDPSPYSAYCHMDFVWSPYAMDYVYQKSLDYIQKYLGPGKFKY